MEQIYLSRRNLLILLSKLDRKAMGEETACAIIKNDNSHPKYPQTMQQIKVVAVEDDEYYTDRNAGQMHMADEENSVDPLRDPRRIAEIRERTSAPIMECKKALFSCDGDVEKAIALLMDPIRWYVGKLFCRTTSSPISKYKCTVCDDSGLAEGLDTYGGSSTFETCDCQNQKKYSHDERGWEPN